MGRSAAREVLEALQDAGVYVPVEGEGGVGQPQERLRSSTDCRGAGMVLRRWPHAGGAWAAPRHPERTAQHCHGARLSWVGLEPSEVLAVGPGSDQGLPRATCATRPVGRGRGRNPYDRRAWQQLLARPGAKAGLFSTSRVCTYTAFRFLHLRCAPQATSCWAGPTGSRTPTGAAQALGRSTARWVKGAGGG